MADGGSIPVTADAVLALVKHLEECDRQRRRTEAILCRIIRAALLDGDDDRRTVQIVLAAMEAEADNNGK